MQRMPVQKLLQNKRYLFWTLQLGGWSSWAITFYLGVLVWSEPPKLYAIYPPIVGALGLLITLALRALYHAVWEKDIVWRVIAVLLGSLLGGSAPKGLCFAQNPVKIVPLPFWPCSAVAEAIPLALCRARFRYPLDPCFHFFPAAKCPTHLT